jgi:hypothetical protein
VDSTALRLQHTGGAGSRSARRRRSGGAFAPPATEASAAAFEAWELGREVRLGFGLAQGLGLALHGTRVS